MTRRRTAAHHRIHHRAGGRYVGSIGVVELLRADRTRTVHELELTMVSVHGNADFTDVA